MKIAFIGLRMFPSNFDGVSGIEVRSEQLIRELAKNHFIYVFTRSWIKQKIPKTYDEKQIQLIKTFTLNNKYLDTPIYSLFASIKSIFLPIDVIFFESSASSLFCFLPRLFGKKIIVTIHSLEWRRRKWEAIGKLFLRLAEKVAFLSAHQIIVVSEDLKDYFWNKYRKSTFYIPYFICQKNKVLPKIIKKKYKLFSNDYILFLGRFVPEKRIEWLIKAYLQLRPVERLVLAGGPSHSNDYVERLKKLALGNKNIIFTGYATGREKEELLSNCSLFVLPSELEGLSISLIEALNYQRKVLIADLPEHKKLIINKQNLFKTGNYLDFYDKLKYLLFSNIDIKSRNYRLKYLLSKKKFLSQYESLLCNLGKN